MAGGPKREHKTEQAIAALLTSPTLEDAAAEIGVSERTLQRWLKEPTFKEAYYEARRKIYSHAVGRAQKAVSRGVDVLWSILNDTEAPASARVAAFARLEDMSRRGVEIEDLDARLAKLEAQLGGQPE